MNNRTNRGAGKPKKMSGGKKALLAAGLVLCVLLIKDRPKGATPPPVEHVMANMGNCIKLPFIWIIGLVMVCVMAYNITAATFLPNALNVNGMELANAGIVAALFSFGGLFGSIFLPTIHDAIFGKVPRVGCIVYGVLCALFMALGWMHQAPLFTGIMGFLGAFFAIGLMPVMLTAMIFIPGMKPEYMGSAGGFQNMMRFLSACVVPAFVIARIAGANYNLMFTIVCVFGVLAGVFAMMVPDNHLKMKGAAPAPEKVEGPAEE